MFRGVSSELWISRASASTSSGPSFVPKLNKERAGAPSCMHAAGAQRGQGCTARLGAADATARERAPEARHMATTRRESLYIQRRWEVNQVIFCEWEFPCLCLGDQEVTS